MFAALLRGNVAIVSIKGLGSVGRGRCDIGLSFPPNARVSVLECAVKRRLGLVDTQPLD
jgi:hypothetical protein